MLQAILKALAGAAALLALAAPAAAGGLRVDPVLLELNAPATAGSFTLHNDSAGKIAVQTRVYRWSQADGKETLEPATDVVASPPVVNLEPGADHIVRCVRLNKQPVQREEATASSSISFRPSALGPSAR